MKDQGQALERTQVSSLPLKKSHSPEDKEEARTLVPRLLCPMGSLAHLGSLSLGSKAIILLRGFLRRSTIALLNRLYISPRLTLGVGNYLKGGSLWTACLPSSHHKGVFHNCPASEPWVWGSECTLVYCISLVLTLLPTPSTKG